MLNKKKKQQNRQPTIEEFLQFRPRRLDFEWSKNDDGFVEINVPKFKSNFGKSFCKIIKKDENFVAKMDKIGTVVWENIDGKKTVEDILKILKKKYPKEKEIDQRLFLFIQQMGSLNYLEY